MNLQLTEHFNAFRKSNEDYFLFATEYVDFYHTIIIQHPFIWMKMVDF